MDAERREWLELWQPGLPLARVEIANGTVRIGRAAENQIVLRDEYASSRHAEIAAHHGGRVVRDLGSTNGTRLNGRELLAGDAHPLQNGDLIEIGDARLTYHAGSIAAPATTPVLNPSVKPAPAKPAPVKVDPARAGAATAAPAARTPGGRPKRHVPGALLLIRFALLVVGVLALVVGFAWLVAPSRTVVLVLGSDARPDELKRGEVGRTDTLLAVVAEKSPGALLLVSIPRDLWVAIPGYGEERINAAFPLGGAGTAERAAGQLLGIPIERHLVIGLQGVRDIVDAAGGVDLDVARPIHDDAYPTDDYGTVVVDIPAGRQHMDGETALRYARTRHQDSDFGRMARQQQVMVALRSRLMQPINWWRAPAVLNAVRQATQTDLRPLDLATLAFAAGLRTGEPDRLALDLGLVEEFRGAGGAFLLRPTPALRQRVAVFLNPSNAAVEVLNATQTPGLAKQAADRLRAQGFNLVGVGDAGLVQRQTSVEVAPGLKRAGALAASMLDVPRENVGEGAALPPGVDVRITLGG